MLVIRRPQSTSPLPSTVYLPFDMPERQTLAASPRKVWAHYFTQFPISISNKNPGDVTDYYEKYWLPPGQVEGTTDWSIYGGWIRDRPLQTRNTDLDPNWRITDKQTEIQYAIDAGLDGFTVDLLSSTYNGGNTVAQRDQLITAANNIADPYFRLVLMPDGNTTATGYSRWTSGTSYVAGKKIGYSGRLYQVITAHTAGASFDAAKFTDIGDYIVTSAQLLASDMSALSSNSCLYKTPDGKLLIAPYGPEFVPNASGTGGGATQKLSYWQAFTGSMAANGAPANLLMCYSANWLDAGYGAPALNSASYGHSRWGLRNPVDNASTNNSAAGAASYCHTTFSKPWMAPVSVGDERAKGGTYNENHGFENLRTSWLAAIGNASANLDQAEYVQIPTWNDYSESAHIAPSRNHGFAFLDVSAFYLVRYKLGYWPVIQRDALYLAHRVQFTSGTTYTGSQSAFETRTGGTPAYDEVEVLVFATGPGTVTITCGSAVTTVTISQTLIDNSNGLVSFQVPLQLGSVSAVFTRSGTTVASVSSQWTVSTTQISQDMNYRVCSSLR